MSTIDSGASIRRRAMGGQCLVCRMASCDGRGVRLPTVLVRAGAPNAATTGCFSAVVREPLAGSLHS